MLSYEQKKALVERRGYTLDGEKCAVAGYAMDYATVAPESGNFYHTDWSEIERAAQDEGRIDRDKLTLASTAWLGVSKGA